MLCLATAWPRRSGSSEFLQDASASFLIGRMEKALLLSIAVITRCALAWGLERQFVVGYAGNLGRAHEIETVLEAMKALYKRSIASPADETAKAIKFIFIGGGALRPRLEAEASVSELGNVQFHGYQPREQLAATLCAADLHLVMLNPKLEGFIVPSKLYAIAAAGRPVIFIGDRSGEVARILNEVGCGFTVEPNDVTGLQHRILQFARSPELCRMMGVRARAAFELQWDKDIAVTRWERLITSMKQQGTVLVSATCEFGHSCVETI